MLGGRLSRLEVVKENVCLWQGTSEKVSFFGGYYCFVGYVVDYWEWTPNRDAGYLVKYGCQMLTHKNQLDPISNKELIWNKTTPLKVSLFTWKLLNNRILSKYNLERWGMLLQVSRKCTCAFEKDENSNHIFLECEFFG